MTLRNLTPKKHHKSLLFGLPTHCPLKYKGVSVLGGPLSVMKVWWISANDKSIQDYFGHAIILSDTHMASTTVMHCSASCRAASTWCSAASRIGPAIKHPGPNCWKIFKWYEVLQFCKQYPPYAKRSWRLPQLDHSVESFKRNGSVPTILPGIKQHRCAMKINRTCSKRHLAIWLHCSIPVISTGWREKALRNDTDICRSFTKTERIPKTALSCCVK